MDELKTFKRNTKDIMDSILLDSIGRSDYSDFKEYKDEMLSMTWDDVIGG